MSATDRPRPVVLTILDGWGHREQCESNAICLALTPNLDRLAASCPQALLDASESHVGLPSGQMGNSEVGHMNIGAGRVVEQDLPRIDSAIEDGTLARSPALARFIDALKESGGTAHIMGLLSPGGVHAHQAHMAVLANEIAGAGVPTVVHAFLDGRDTPPRSALDHLAAFAEATAAPIATVCGRYYALDRDQRWPRIAQAYHMLTRGRGEAGAARAPSARAAVAQAYEAGQSDEFVPPTVIGDYPGMAAGDGLLMANYRADRARQLLTALLDPAFDAFARGPAVEFAAVLGMVSYSAELDARLDILFPRTALSASLGEVVAAAGLHQLRIAETEKYAHVTFFFNGGRETVFPGEERILIPSPQVATYDLQPEMSAPEMTERLLAAVESGRFDLIIVNYANGDMVGHTGNLTATQLAVEAVDGCIGRLAAAVAASGGCLLVTSDHGNAEQMDDATTGQPHTSHTMNRVPLIVMGAPDPATRLTDGRLSDIAPTILAILGLPQPAEMSGHSLIRADQRNRTQAPAEAAAE